MIKNEKKWQIVIMRKIHKNDWKWHKMWYSTNNYSTSDMLKNEKRMTCHSEEKWLK